MNNKKVVTKTNLIISIIGYLVFSAIGAASIIIITLGILDHYNIIDFFMKIENFSLEAVFLGYIISCVFLIIPLKGLVRNFKKLKNKDYQSHFGRVVDCYSIQDVPTKTPPSKSNKQIQPDLQQPITQQHKPKKSSGIGFVITWIVVLAILLACGIALVMQGERWGWIFLLFMIPILYIILSIIFKKPSANKTVKNDLDALFFALSIITPLCLGPFIVIEDYSLLLQPIGIIYLSLGGFLFLLIFSATIYNLFFGNIGNKMLSGKLPCDKMQATYEGCKFSSSTSASINGVPKAFNVKYKVIYSYLDNNGIRHTKTSNQVFSFDEVAYLKSKQTFDILVYKTKSIITEDLSNINIPTTERKDTAQMFSNDKIKNLMPYFAKKNRWTIVCILGVIGTLALGVIGTLIVINNPSDYLGWLIITISIIYAIPTLSISIPNILSEKKGSPTTGILMRLESRKYGRKNTGSVVLFAVVEINGEDKDIRLLYDEWYGILQEFIAKEIPLKVYKKTVTIDFHKLYSNLI